ncbi:LPXTG cell wall anchor domain-containing protein [Streptococcus suis]|uniref:LPXTG cell wall anchor domain-containing protein n=1 Tax=Streptococcus suis TaxID=1307 RepID=UPI000CF4499C|nr:LPXTG cell wall anchor domain-containing protein [Streptococcus suis]
MKRSSRKMQIHKWVKLGVGLATVTVLGGVVETTAVDIYNPLVIHAEEEVIEYKDRDGNPYPYIEVTNIYDHEDGSGSTVLGSYHLTFWNNKDSILVTTPELEGYDYIGDSYSRVVGFDEVKNQHNSKLSIVNHYKKSVEDTSSSSSPDTHPVTDTPPVTPPVSEQAPTTPPVDPAVQPVSFKIYNRIEVFWGPHGSNSIIEVKEITLQPGESYTFTAPQYKEYSFKHGSLQDQTLTNDGNTVFENYYINWYTPYIPVVPAVPDNYSGEVLAGDVKYQLRVVDKINGEERGHRLYRVPANTAVAPALLTHPNYGDLVNFEAGEVNTKYYADRAFRFITLNYSYPEDKLSNGIYAIPTEVGKWSHEKKELPVTSETDSSITPSTPTEKPVETSAETPLNKPEETTTVPQTTGNQAGQSVTSPTAQPKQEGESTTTVGKPVNTPTSPVEPSTVQTTNPVSEEIKPTVKEQLEPSKVTSLDSYKDVTETSSSVTVRVRGEDVAKVASLSIKEENDPAVIAKLPQAFAEQQVDLYDIKTLDAAGQFVQITEDATVTLPVEAGKEVDKVIYFLASTGAVEELPFTVDKSTNQVSFVVSHFSHYGIVYQANKPVSQAQSGSTGQSAPGKQETKQETKEQAAPASQSKQATVKPAPTSQPQAKSLPATGEAHSVLHMTGMGLLGLAGLVVKRRSRKSS